MLKSINHNSVEEEPLSQYELNKAVECIGLVVLEESDVLRFQSDFNELIEKGELSTEDIEKGRKDLSKLTKKKVSDKNGKTKTVYVKVGDQKKEAGSGKTPHDHARGTDDHKLERYMKEGTDKDLKEVAKQELSKRKGGADKESGKDSTKKNGKEEGDFMHHRMMAGYHSANEEELNGWINHLKSQPEKNLHDTSPLDKRRDKHANEAIKHRKKAEALHNPSMHGKWNDTLPSAKDAIKYGENHEKSGANVKDKERINKLSGRKSEPKEDISKKIFNKQELIDAGKSVWGDDSEFIIDERIDYNDLDLDTAKISDLENAFDHFANGASESGEFSAREISSIIKDNEKFFNKLKSGLTKSVNPLIQRVIDASDIAFNKAMEAVGNPLVIQDLEGNNNRDGKKPVVKGGNKHDFSTKERKKLAGEGQAENNGSYPIRNEQDLKDAIKAVGRSKDIEKTKRWIKKRASELGKESLLPDSWK